MPFYLLFTWLYPKIAWVLSFSNQKAGLWLEGRKGLFEKLEKAFTNNTQPVIWMHCSSLGEFEQGLPVLENIRSQYPGYRILLTFFSPSGYEIRKNYAGVDDVFYLPMDSLKNAKRFFNIVNPSLILFVKYEYWYFYLHQAKQRNIPLLLVSGIFRRSQPFFKWYGGFHRKILSLFSFLFIQNIESAELLKGIGLQKQVVISGDTRFDRVINIAQRFTPIDLIEKFCNHHPTLIAGSTWTDDDEELDHFANIHPQIKCIIAPHDIEKERLDECLLLYKHSILFSEYQKNSEEGKNISDNINVLIIDNMGMLSKLYHYATVCYIGGGFGDDGIHNALEAAVYGKPVVFGPVYDKYIEAGELIEYGGAFSIDDALELETLLEELFNDKATWNTAASASAQYVIDKAGATAKLMNYIQENRLLIN